MAQVERATSKNGKLYLTNEVVANLENFVNLGDNCSIGNNLIIGEDLVVGNDTTIGSNLTIGNDAKIGNNTVIGEDATIGNNVELGNNLIMPLYEPKTITEYVQILNQGSKGIKFGNKKDSDYTGNVRNGYITVVDGQFLINGTSGDPNTEYVILALKGNKEIRITTELLRMNGQVGLNTTQVFKDGAGTNRTMTITNGIITGIS